MVNIVGAVTIYISMSHFLLSLNVTVTADCIVLCFKLSHSVLIIFE